MIVQRQDAPAPCFLAVTALFGFLALVFIPTPVQGLDPTRELTQYSDDIWQTKEGLPDNHVQSIAQTPDGYLWFGVEEGAARFDGVHFAIFDTACGALRGNSVTALQVDREGALWLGTIGGLTRYKNGSFKTFTTADGLPNNVVRALHLDQNGELWIGTMDGLARLKDERFTRYTVQDGLTVGYVTALSEDQDGSLWIGTWGGGVNQFQNGKFRAFTTAEGLANDGVRALYTDHDGNLWVGTAGGLSCRTNGRFRTYTTADGLTADHILSLLEDRAGNLWVGTNGGGINRLRNGKFDSYTAREGLANDIVGALFEDNDGCLWMGTNGGGVHCLKNGKFQAITSKHGLPADCVWSVCQDDHQNVWLGTQKGLACLGSGKTETYSTRDGLSKDIVLSVAAGHDGSMWVGTYSGGLNHFKDGRFTVYTTREGLADNDVRSIVEDRAGRLWAGTMGGGLSCFANGKFTKITTENGLSHNSVQALLEAHDGTLWIGTSGGGLNQLKDGKVTRCGLIDEASPKIVFCIVEDHAGTIWLGTERGLVRYENDTFVRYPSVDGAFNGAVFGVIEDNENNLWLTANRGIARIERSALDRFSQGSMDTVALSTYTTAHGLKSLACSGAVQPSLCKGADGRLWFATYKGVAVVDPARLFPNETPPLVHIEKVMVDGVELAQRQPAVCPPGRGELEFHYTGLSFRDSAGIRFKYQLVGFDTSWTEAGTRREAYYTNLPPGRYRFRVLACNGDGVWNEAGESFEILLQPHFYQTTWFYGACTVLVGLIGIGLPLERFRQLRARQRELSQRVEERTQELRDEIAERRRSQEQLQAANLAAQAAIRAKSAFLANMSHEIRTPMNGVLGMTELLLETQLNSEQRNYLGMVKSSAGGLLSLINDILDFSKIEAGKLDLDPRPFDLRECLGDTLKTMGVLAHQKGLELSCRIAPDVPNQLVGDALRLRQIILNLVGNALKFTEKGEVVVQVARQAECQAMDGNKRPEAKVVNGATEWPVASQSPHPVSPSSRVSPAPPCGDVCLAFAVRDTGIGISAEKQQIIFGAFTQVDESSTRRFGGTGLGLAVSARLIELMGGRIAVESALGQGSTFTFTACFGQGAASAQPEAWLAGLAGLQVLVVDDNDTHRAILGELLTNWRMVPILVDSGQAALKAMAQAATAGRPIGLVLLDARMPPPDGFAVAEEIRRRPELCHPALIMLATTDSPPEIERRRLLSVNCCLWKPVKQSELLDGILNVLARTPRPLGHPPESTPGPTPAPVRTLKVLLVEDNVVNRELALRLLVKRGHTVVVACNGVEALDALDREKFDAVLMDVQMPEMDGLEATARWRQREAATASYVPVIALTAHAMKGDQDRCLAAGMDGYLTKPLAAAELYETLERLGSLSLASVTSAPTSMSRDAANEPPPSRVADTFDATAALAGVGHDVALLGELVTVFARQAPELVAGLRAALSRRDSKVLERSAHKLKGSLGVLGAIRSFESATRLELLARAQDWEAAARTLTALEVDIPILVQSLMKFTSATPKLSPI